MPIRAPLAREVALELRRRFEAGEPAKAISIDLGVSATAIREYCADLPQPRADGRRLAILTCLDEGLSIPETAKKAGVRVGMVVRILRALTLAKEPRVATPEEFEQARLERNARDRERRRARLARKLQAMADALPTLPT